jgi:hypothetical protein
MDMTTKAKLAVKNKSISLRLPEGLLELIEMHSREQRSDPSSTIRLWLYRQAEGYALSLVKEGRLSIGRATELMDMTHYEFQELARSNGMELGPTEEQAIASREVSSRIGLTPKK